MELKDIHNYQIRMQREFKERMQRYQEHLDEEQEDLLNNTWRNEEEEEKEED